MPNELPGVTIADEIKAQTILLGAPGAQVPVVAPPRTPFVASVSVNPPSIAAATHAEVDVTVTGVHTGDLVTAECPAAVNDDILHVGTRVKATNTVTLRLYNPTGGAIDDAAQTWAFKVYPIA